MFRWLERSDVLEDWLDEFKLPVIRLVLHVQLHWMSTGQSYNNVGAHTVFFLEERAKCPKLNFRKTEIDSVRVRKNSIEVLLRDKRLLTFNSNQKLFFSSGFAPAKFVSFKPRIAVRDILHLWESVFPRGYREEYFYKILNRDPQKATQWVDRLKGFMRFSAPPEDLRLKFQKLQECLQTMRPTRANLLVLVQSLLMEVFILRIAIRQERWEEEQSFHRQVQVFVQEISNILPKVGLKPRIVIQSSRSAAMRFYRGDSLDDLWAIRCPGKNVFGKRTVSPSAPLYCATFGRNAVQRFPRLANLVQNLYFLPLNATAEKTISKIWKTDTVFKKCLNLEEIPAHDLNKLKRLLQQCKPPIITDMSECTMNFKSKQLDFQPKEKTFLKRLFEAFIVYHEIDKKLSKGSKLSFQELHYIVGSFLQIPKLDSYLQKHKLNFKITLPNFKADSVEQVDTLQFKTPPVTPGIDTEWFRRCVHSQNRSIRQTLYCTMGSEHNLAIDILTSLQIIDIKPITKVIIQSIHEYISTKLKLKPCLSESSMKTLNKLWLILNCRNCDFFGNEVKLENGQILTFSDKEINSAIDQIDSLIELQKLPTLYHKEVETYWNCKNKSDKCFRQLQNKLKGAVRKNPSEVIQLIFQLKSNPKCDDTCHQRLNTWLDFIKLTGDEDYGITRKYQLTKWTAKSIYFYILFSLLPKIQKIEHDIPNSPFKTWDVLEGYMKVLDDENTYVKKTLFKQIGIHKFLETLLSWYGVGTFSIPKNK